jgi:type III restriction enzyme
LNIRISLVARAKLREKYSDIYLLRNEKLFQLYRFSDGSAIEPDFVLFLKDSNGNQFNSYQLFIEPKCEQLIPIDIWKEEFLKEI